MPIIPATKYIRSESESFGDVEALLEGCVFHVTRREYWPAIQRAGAVFPNIDGSLASSFGSSANSFFRNRGCVSVFDYRESPDEEIVDFRRRCYPFQPAAPGNEGITVLVLNTSLHEHLQPWTRWQDEKAYGEMIVPRVEAGHIGQIP
ncbi:hypothetical protein NYL07_09160, partial [Xanthomonas translucens pv. translucens]|uniref:hypothetical protein n=1 Tax=Xanthomonas campestris pv. translucens TaxID=343 RepID=UPI0021653B92